MRASQQTTTSAFQQQVVAALRRLGVALRLERITLDDFFTIDVSLVWGGR